MHDGLTGDRIFICNLYALHFISFVLSNCVMYFVAGCESDLLPLCWMVEAIVGSRQGLKGSVKKRGNCTTVA
jgi:hypothetical protein